MTPPSQPIDPCKKCPTCRMQMSLVFDHLFGQTYMRCFWCRPGATR